MSTLRDRIYNILYKNSTIDLSRILHEDQWPIEELEKLCKQKILDLLPEEDYCPSCLNNEWDNANNWCEQFREQRARNELRAQLRKEVEKL